MNTLTFAAPSLSLLRAELRHPDLESAAILLCSPMRLTTGGWRLLVKEVHVPAEADYAHRSPVRVELRSEFCLPIEQTARRENLSLVYVHTHPGTSEAVFSEIDDEAERLLAAYLKMRGTRVPHAALLFAGDSVAARMLGAFDPVAVSEVGERLERHSSAHEGEAAGDQFDRQIRAFGADGQHRLQALKVAIVGLGGTGSVVAQQTAYLGVEEFFLVDDDHIETTNLNRVVGATRSDVGVAKVDVARRMIESINANATVSSVKADVTSNEVARRVIEADIVFCCTDSHASRHVLNQAAYQYLTPVIDLGVSINVATDGTASFAGHAKLLAPGQACLWCIKNLNAEQVRRELMTDEQRAGDPYVNGAVGIVQPSVISLNSTLASISVTMLLSIIAGVPSAPRYILYQGNRARMNAAACDRDDACPFCGHAAPLGWGDLIKLPGSQ